MVTSWYRLEAGGPSPRPVTASYAGVLSPPTGASPTELSPPHPQPPQKPGQHLPAEAIQAPRGLLARLPGPAFPCWTPGATGSDWPWMRHPLTTPGDLPVTASSACCGCSHRLPSHSGEQGGEMPGRGRGLRGDRYWPSLSSPRAVRARCLGDRPPPLHALTSPHPSLVGVGQETQASQLALRQELLPQMKWLLKIFSKMEFSPSGDNGGCVGRRHAGG